MDIRTFIKTEADNIWDPDTKHFKECLARLERFCNFNGNGDRDIKTLKARDIRDFQKHLATLKHEKGPKKDKRLLTDSSINRYSAAVSALIKHAVISKHAVYVPYIKYKNEGDGRPRVFTGDEKDRLVAFLQRSRAPWMADMAILSLQTGMRLGEIIKIGTPGATLIKRPGMPVYIKALLRLHDTKNGDTRDVPLNEIAKEAYDRLAGMHGGFWSSSIFYDVWAEARSVIASGDKDFVFHVCRHSAATEMANMNINTTLIGKFLGHRARD